MSTATASATDIKAFYALAIFTLVAFLALVN